MATNPFAGRSTRILSVPDVLALIDMRETLEVQREAFLAQAAGTVTASPNAWLRLPDQERRRGWLKLLAGHESRSGSLGVKVLARFADNPPGANLGSLVLLFDDDNGFPLAVMDGVIITGLRTGAGAGLATERLAPADADEVGVVGTGVVAWNSLAAVTLVRPSIRRVRVFSRSAERREAFAARAAAELGVEASSVDTVGAAVAGAPVLITATNAPEPVLLPEHLESGQFINAMGIRTEVHPDALARTWVVPDGTEEAIADGKFSVALSAGTVRESDIGPSLGAVLADPSIGHDPGRIALFDSSGIAAQDITMARRVLERAVERGVGVEVDLHLELAEG